MSDTFDLVVVGSGGGALTGAAPELVTTLEQDPGFDFEWLPFPRESPQREDTA